MVKARDKLYLLPMKFAVSKTNIRDPMLVVLARKKFKMISPLRSDELKPKAKKLMQAIIHAKLRISDLISCP